jgi:hypothetical protein
MELRFTFEYTAFKGFFFGKKDRQSERIVYDEIMINGGTKLSKNTFDQNRVYVAVQLG